MKSIQASCAKHIRKELKEKYPTFKFSVRSDRGSVFLEWDNGPEQKEVINLLSKYKIGSFNAVEDIYEYNNKNEKIPQVDYIFTQRTLI